MSDKTEFPLLETMFHVISPSSPKLQCLENIKMNEIIYVPIYPERYNDVIQHLRYNFFADEPLNKSLMLCKPGQTHEELEEFSLSVISQGVSFMGVLSTTGEVVGVLLNGYETGHKTLDSKCYKDQKLQKIFDFLGGVDKDVDFLTQYNVRSILELKILSVDMKFRGRGIAQRLYEITEKFAQSNGFTLLRTDATALFSQKVFQKYGFTTLKEIVYDEYPSKDAPLFIVEAPHVSFKLMGRKMLLPAPETMFSLARNIMKVEASWQEFHRVTIRLGKKQNGRNRGIVYLNVKDNQSIGTLCWAVHLPTEPRKGACYMRTYLSEMKIENLRLNFC